MATTNVMIIRPHKNSHANNAKILFRNLQSMNEEILVKWKRLLDCGNSWELCKTLKQLFPHPHLGDKVSLDGWGNVRMQVYVPHKKHGKEGRLKTDGRKLELTDGSYTAKERVPAKQQRSWTTKCSRETWQARRGQTIMHRKRRRTLLRNKKGSGEEQQGINHFTANLGKLRESFQPLECRINTLLKLFFILFLYEF